MAFSRNGTRARPVFNNNSFNVPRLAARRRTGMTREGQRICRRMCYLTLRVVSPPRPFLIVASLRRVPAHNYNTHTRNTVCVIYSVRSTSHRRRFIRTSLTKKAQGNAPRRNLKIPPSSRAPTGEHREHSSARPQHGARAGRGHARTLGGVPAVRALWAVCLLWVKVYLLLNIMF
jgi:hypothetical protein